MRRLLVPILPSSDSCPSFFDVKTGTHFPEMYGTPQPKARAVAALAPAAGGNPKAGTLTVRLFLALPPPAPPPGPPPVGPAAVKPWCLVRSR